MSNESIENITSELLLPHIKKEICSALQIHTSIVIAIAIYLTTCIGTVYHYGNIDIFFSQLSMHYSHAITLYCACLAIALTSRCAYIMFFIRPQKLFRYIKSDITDKLPTIDRIIFALPIIILLPLFFSTFSTFKIMIPYIHPFDYDHALATIDKALHFGKHPWEWLQPVLGHPAITFVIDQIYFKGWFLVMYLSLTLQAFNSYNPQLRMRFFLSCICTWILLGNIAATFLSSAGPCYYNVVTGSQDPYSALHSYLTGVNDSIYLYAINLQNLLWNLHINHSQMLGSGISAAPSMHVAMTFLITLTCWHINKKLYFFSILFLLIILAGSVHLNWHYAVDGYLSIVGTWLIWILIGALTKNIKTTTQDSLLST
ncbi:phosphatase PAP2 family protein [Halodesulfovibrio marinisediminis]|uniref:Inositolphosphotransferase Aur1/Ipt1 domain-containing protein n=1 Tax=Halodesulfovibrio marinisediminis DSM 17456 TaxID=1121457 RepID=A0A1N6I241_9BACT|nr:phosphatase PAP2 family protein [Halodesulfovibrio marinisediminis]SIO26081.1 hypothetical protein SAMN02745161_2354 [Halodesulfovibrio marinisediminis DSM 17456]